MLLRNNKESGMYGIRSETLQRWLVNFFRLIIGMIVNLASFPVLLEHSHTLQEISSKTESRLSMFIFIIALIFA